MEETLLYSKSMIQVLKTDSKRTDLGDEEFIIFQAVNPYAFLDHYVVKNNSLLYKHQLTFNDDLRSVGGINRMIIEMNDTIDFPIPEEFLNGNYGNNIGYFNKVTHEFALINYERKEIIWENRYEYISIISIPGNTIKTTFRKKEGGIDNEFFEGFFNCIDHHSKSLKPYQECKIVFPCPNCGKDHSTIIKTSMKPAVINILSVIQGQGFNCECGTNFRTVEPYNLFEII